MATGHKRGSPLAGTAGGSRKVPRIGSLAANDNEGYDSSDDNEGEEEDLHGDNTQASQRAKQAPPKRKASEGDGDPDGKKQKAPGASVRVISSLAVVQMPLHDDFAPGTLRVKHSPMSNTAALSAEALADKACIKHNLGVLSRPAPVLCLGVVRAIMPQSATSGPMRSSDPRERPTPLGHAELKTVDGRSGYWLGLQEERVSECAGDPFVTLAVFDSRPPLVLTEILGCKDDVATTPPALRGRYLTTFLVAFMHFFECCLQGEGAMKLDADHPEEDEGEKEEEEEGEEGEPGARIPPPPSGILSPSVFSRRGRNDAEGDDDSEEDEDEDRDVQPPSSGSPLGGGSGEPATDGTDKKKRAKLHTLLQRAVRVFYRAPSKGYDHAKKMLDRPDLRKFIELHVRMMSPLKWAQCAYMHYYGNLDVINKNVVAPTSQMDEVDLFKYMFDYETHTERLATAMPGWADATFSSESDAAEEASVWDICEKKGSLIYDVKLLHVQRSVVGQNEHPRNLCPLSSIFVGTENPKEEELPDGDVARFTMLRPFRCGTLESFQCREDFSPALALLRELRHGEFALARLAAAAQATCQVRRLGNFSLEAKAADAQGVLEISKCATAAQYSELDRPVFMTDIDAYADPAVPTRARELGLENRDKDRDRSWRDLGCETTLDVFSVAMSASHDLQEHLAASDIVRLRLIYGNMRWQMSQRQHVPKRRETLMHTRIGVGGLDLLCDMRLMFYNEGKTHDAVDALRILAIMIQQYMRVDTADSRQNPFLILTGPPGQGKTDMISMMMKLLTQSQESKAYAGDAYAEQFDMKNSVSQQAMNYEGDLRKKAAERGGTPTTLRDNSYLSTIFPDLNPDQFNVSEFVVNLQALITEWGTDRITTHRNEASGELGCIRHRTVGFSRPQIVCCNLPEENLVGGEGASRGNGGVPEAILDRADKCRVGSIPQVPYPTLLEGAERAGGAFEVGHEVTSKTMLSNYMETALSEDHTGDLLRQEHERCVRGLGFVPAAVHYLDHHMTTLRKMNDPMCFESLTKLCINALSRASLALRSDAAASGGVSLRQLKRHCSTMLAVHHVTSIVGYTSPHSTAETNSVTEPGEIAWDMLMGSAPWRVSCATCTLFVGYASLLHKPTQDTEFDDTIRFLLRRQTLSSLISGYPHVELTGEQQMALDADHTSRARKLEIDPHHGQRTEDWDDSDYMAHRVEDTGPSHHGAAMAGSGECTNFFKRQVVYLLPVTSVKSAQANRLSKAHSNSSGKSLEDSDLQPLAEMIRLNWRGRKPPVSDKASIEILRAELKKQQDPSPIVKVQTWVPEPGAVDADDGSWEDITNDVDNRIPQQERFDQAHRLVTTDPPRRCDGKSMGFDKRLGALVVSSRFLAQRVIKKATADSEEHVMKHGETLSSPQIVTVAYGLLMMDIAHWVDNQQLANLYRKYVKALPACTDAVLKVQQCASRPPPKFTREFLLAVIGICDPFAHDVFAGVCSVENAAVCKLFDFGALSRASKKLRDVASKPGYEGATLARRCSDADLATFPPEWLHSVRTEDKELGSFCIGRENVHCVPFVNVGGDGNTDCGYPSSGMPGYRTTLDELGIAHAEYESWCKTHCVAISDTPSTEEEWTKALHKAGYDPLKERKRTLAEGGAVHRLRASGVTTGVHRTCSELQRDVYCSRKARPDLADSMPVPCLLARRADVCV